MNPKPGLEPLLLALWTLMACYLIMGITIIFRMSNGIPKTEVEIAFYGGLMTLFPTAVGAVVNALSRDRTTERLNAQAAVVTAGTAQTVANALPTAPPAVQPVQVMNEPNEPVPTAPQEPAT